MNRKVMCGMDATGSMKRSDFGMHYGLPGVGDDLRAPLKIQSSKQNEARVKNGDAAYV